MAEHTTRGKFKVYGSPRAFSIPIDLEPEESCPEIDKGNQRTCGVSSEGAQMIQDMLHDPFALQENIHSGLWSYHAFN